MKKLLTVFLCLSLLCVLIACAPKRKSEAPTVESTVTPTSDFTEEPTVEKNDALSAEPTGEPSSEATVFPSTEISDEPTFEKTEPTSEKTEPTSEKTNSSTPEQPSEASTGECNHKWSVWEVIPDTAHDEFADIQRVCTKEGCQGKEILFDVPKWESPLK